MWPITVYLFLEILCHIVHIRPRCRKYGFSLDVLAN